MKLSQLTEDRRNAASLITEIVVAAKLAICHPKNTAKGEDATPEQYAHMIYEEVEEVLGAESRAEAIRECGDVLWTCALLVWRRWEHQTNREEER